MSEIRFPPNHKEGCLENALMSTHPGIFGTLLFKGINRDTFKTLSWTFTVH